MASLCRLIPKNICIQDRPATDAGQALSQNTIPRSGEIDLHQRYTAENGLGWNKPTETQQKRGTAR